MTKGSSLLVAFAVLLFFVMFIYSGINKILRFNTKANTLSKKINCSDTLAKIGMMSVIALEILASVYLIFYAFLKKPNQRGIFYTLAIAAIILFMIFMIVVTIIYHPPGKSVIPFLSNLTTFAGLLLMLYAFLQ